ncbi:adenine deaminase C-terminal domain-containing protein [Exiguobacterium sp. AB2]|uniref:adenine deaminase C-terminal domain-containing protein n=1 Tax=Exiguobacterium sp. AB2 TaxID=1484479 RepID=UPI0004A964B3|nr:adenine deaminase C-terminal domain-containing protein [Exiguobacterium sp. AB2]KDN57367.1 adenine deaminase [Exiguobacterium sp. AB2]
MPTNRSARAPWSKTMIRSQLEVVDQVRPPSLVLTNATYLNVYVKQWKEANIWIENDRIVYVGPDLPKAAVETVDVSGKFIVPGYMEPHAHPFQLYNPATLSKYAGERGTTTLVNDNMLLFLQNKEQAFAQLDAMQQLPTSTYWWARLDTQTELDRDSVLVDTERIHDWFNHPDVIMAGELTAWPRTLKGDDEMLQWMLDAESCGLPVEGHFPGASAKTLTKMALMGVHSDHEAMTAEEALCRLEHGYTTTLRHSSIRPDLPEMMDGLLKAGLTAFDHLMVTTDGSTPGFYEAGMQDQLVKIMMEAGLDPIEAYRIVSLNAARHFDLDHVLGSIAPGRIAHLNILDAVDDPRPTSVIAKGQWIVRDGVSLFPDELVEAVLALMPATDVEIELTLQDLSFSMPVGLDMVNSVIMKLFKITHDTGQDELPREGDESFLMLLDKEGKWRLNTVLKGFANDFGGLVSSYSISGDYLILGKCKQDMLTAFARMKELGGGIVLVDRGEIIAEIPLPLCGMTSTEPIERLIEQEKQLREELVTRGYHFEDPIYTLLFLASTHLPYVRATPLGIYEVMKKQILFPAILR